MKRCLVDVNVLLALLVRHHEHHTLALRWFGKLAPGEAVLCRFVQLALLRLLGNRNIMGSYALSAAAAWTLLSELLEDERVEFAHEPPKIDLLFPAFLRHPVPTGKLIGDAYLAAFAMASDCRLVTLDKGFRQFRDLQTEILTV